MRSPSLIALALTGAALAGCAGAKTQFYTLDPAVGGPAPAYAAAYAGPPVRIDAVHVPPALDRLELVEPDGANAVKVRDLAHWAAPLGEMARRVLTQDLAARLPQGSVVFPDSPKPQGARGIVVDMLALSPGADGVTLDASWSVLPGARGGALRQRQARLTTAAAAQPAAISALIGQLADRIAADLASAPPEPAASPPQPASPAASITIRTHP